MDRKKQLQEQFTMITGILSAVGDPTRQELIFALLELPCQEARVGEITAKSHLSRPAVSHHLKILKENGIVSMRREGTKNYYFLNPQQEQLLAVRNILDQLIQETTQHSYKGAEND